ncbi:Phospholipase/carboxylesterase family protein [hydrothermal vent metagenome]|uniref:Phospholipase/carboxylesterase family protein n=1 Tax=hydrothermal vent metagenome TaxID=652676 RepID=A0A3B0WZJ1_9ZZZZ
MSELDSIIIETQEQPNAAVIWLHGLGANGHDFEPIVEQLQLPSHYAIRFIFPNAPVRPITINQGYQMPGWYDISSLSIVEQEDEVGIKESSAILKELCEGQEASGIDASRIIVAGFSQGGAIALHCGCRYPRTLAGIMALSTYLPLPESTADEISETANEIPIFMAHGRQDDVVAYEYGKQSMTQLESLEMEVHWHEYDMGHSVCLEEIQHIRQWLTEIL